MARFLVTGSAGFIGGQLVAQLTASGNQVTGFDSRGQKEQVDFIHSLNVSQFDAIFHVGANSSTLESNVQSIFETNYLFTRDLSTKAKLARVPLIYSSSAACYGESGNQPSNLYAWSKLAGEDIVIRDGGIALRYFNVYGPGECHKGSMASFVHQAVATQSAGREVFLFPGSPKRDFIHVEDVCSANIAAAQDFSHLAGKTYDVGTGKAQSFEDCLLLAGVEWGYTEDDAIPHGYQFFTQAGPSNFIPGWRAKPFEEMMRSYCEYMKDRCEH